MRTRSPVNAHLPSWLKAALADARLGRRTYADVGHHLAKHHEDFFDEDGPPVRLADLSAEDFEHPTRTLRRLFASEEHPQADLVDLIPMKRRRAVLEGMACEEGIRVCGPCERWSNR